MDQLLLVEDDPLVALTTEMLLKELGYQVITAEDGPAAMAQLELHSDELVALVTDVKLLGADGWAVAKRARQLRPNLPVLYLSGDSGVDWGENGVPGSAMLPKPFPNGKLALELTKLVAATA